MPAKRTIPESKSTRVFGQSRKPAKMLRAGLYARVATAERQTLPMQLRALREYAAKRGWIIVEEVKEVGSGAVARAFRQRLLDAARRREIDVVLVWRPDPVSTLQELTELGVGFVSLTEALDLNTPTGRAMAGLLAVFAAFERDILGERVRAGLDHARRQGKTLGRPATAAARAGSVRDLFLAGISKSEIAQRLKIGRTPVRRILAQKKS